MGFTHSQKRMSLLEWLMVPGMVAFLASAVLKIIPHYADYYSLEKAITSVETDKAAKVCSMPKFCSYIGKGMQISDTRSLSLEKALEVQLEDNQLQAYLKHEKHESLISNIGLVVHFDKGFRVCVPQVVRWADSSANSAVSSKIGA